MGLCKDRFGGSSKIQTCSSISAGRIFPPAKPHDRSTGSLLHAAVGEGVAGDDLGDEGLHFVVGFGDGFHHLVDDDLIVAFELAAEGVG